MSATEMSRMAVSPRVELEVVGAMVRASAFVPAMMAVIPEGRAIRAGENSIGFAKGTERHPLKSIG